MLIPDSPCREALETLTRALELLKMLLRCSACDRYRSLVCIAIAHPLAHYRPLVRHPLSPVHDLSPAHALLPVGITAVPVIITLCRPSVAGGKIIGMDAVGRMAEAGE